MNEPSKPLIPEWADVEELKRKLEALNWKDGKDKYGLTENLLLENLIYDPIFEERFHKINKTILDDLEEKEKREVIDHVKNLLKNAPEGDILDYLKSGMDYTVKRSERRTYRLIDYDNIENNSFVYGHEIKFKGYPDNIRPDFTLFINGIPIAIIEVKPSTRIRSEEEAIEQIRRYEEESPDLFRLVQIGIAYGDKKLYMPTYPNTRKEKRRRSANAWRVDDGDKKIDLIEEILKHDILLDIIRWYTFLIKKEDSLERIICRYNQYYASKRALARIEGYLNGSDKSNGLIWHWQGSGKTHIMFFIANRFFEEYIEYNPLIFFIVDRRELQKQLKEDFLDKLKAEKFKDYLKVISSIDELKEEIKTIKRSEYKSNIIKKQIYIVLIQKFEIRELKTLLIDLAYEYLEHLKDNNMEEYVKIIKSIDDLPQDKKEEMLINIGNIKKREVILLIDEAHRSQYGLLASMVKNIFPNAMRFAFTGTPVFRFEEKNTFKEFAYPEDKEYYLHVYFIKDSITDGFTLPIIYDVVKEGDIKGEGIKIPLSDEEVKQYIENYVNLSREGSAADDIEDYLDDNENIEQKISSLTWSDIRKNLDRIKVILIDDKRLKALAEFIAERIEKDTDNFRFKAMVVTANREACVKMKRFLDGELIKRYYEKYGDSVKRWTEVVMTYNYNDTGIKLEYKGELIKRRGKSDTNEINSDIQREFKEKEEPKILIVTDMLITGFDAPRLNVMYLDKPLYEHRLLQTIARVNRPYNDGIAEKKYGLIVDSIGLLKHLKESIRTYNLIADNRIANDVEENVLGEIDKKAEEFSHYINDLKKGMESLIIDNRELYIDIDRLIELKKKDRKKALEIIKEEVEPKLKIIAVLHDTPEVQKLINDLKEVIDQYRSLGSHRIKIHYIIDIELLNYIYGMIIYYIECKKLPRDFWDGLLSLIHDKSIIEEFKVITSAKITNEMLKDIIKGEIKIVNEKDIADAYRLLRSLLEENLANPIYKAIHERVERVRKEWINNKRDNVIFANVLKESAKEKLDYDEKIANKPMIERIKDTIKILVKKRFEIDIDLDLKELIDTINKVMEASRIMQSHEYDVRTALMKDLFKNIKKIDAREIKRFAEEVSRDYIMNEIKRNKNA